MWGVRIRFGAPSEGIARPQRLVGEHVQRGPAQPAGFQPPRQAPVRSTTPPRAVLTRIAPGFMRPTAPASIRPRVASVRGTCRLTASATSSRAWSRSPRRATAVLLPGRVVGRDVRVAGHHLHPSAAARAATLRAIPPNPTSPGSPPRPRGRSGAGAASRRPRPSHRRGIGAAAQDQDRGNHVFRHRHVIGAGRREEPRPCGSGRPPGRCLSSPTPSRPTAFRRGAAASNFAGHHRAVAHDQGPGNRPARAARAPGSSTRPVS